MRKEQLVKALLRVSKSVDRAKSGATMHLAKPIAAKATSIAPMRAASAPIARNGATPMAAKPAVRPTAKPATPKADSAASRRIQLAKLEQQRFKNLSSNTPQNKPGGVKDRLVAMVRDPYWLHAYWELSRTGVERAEAALGQEWHSAKPILRVLEVSEGGTTSAAETKLRDIDIHGGVSNWYIDVKNPPCSYRVVIGYLATSGRFHALARSNVVSTPRPGSKDSLDENWSAVAEDCEKIYAMSGGYNVDGDTTQLQELFEERLRRPMGSPMLTGYGSGVQAAVPRRKSFTFEMDAELIVYGTTEPDAHVTLQGDPVKLREDGTFTVRYSMPNCRQVIPAVACSANGLEQRTVVLAVERNTKVMEPVVRDSSD
ncbi:MAG: DUF4912 domain-containing protein [Planctomycetes bacterium]|nr:DUF4912 domain-containing protein [Planctomycetota bacterium]